VYDDCYTVFFRPFVGVFSCLTHPPRLQLGKASRRANTLWCTHSISYVFPISNLTKLNGEFRVRIGLKPTS
jgi:hypothetical protein